MENKKKDELQNRREFFKKAAKGALPILGAILLANVPGVMRSHEGKTPNDCNYNCGYSCSYQCTTSCKGSCNASCVTGCKYTCKLGCNDYCSNGCFGYCG